MKKSQVVVLVSVILSVAAAVAATIWILKHIKKKNSIAPADLAFENDFDDFDDIELDLDEIPAEA